MKKLLICGLMVGLLSSVGVAQRARSMGPAARTPGMEPIAPNAHMGAGSASVGHSGISPSAVPAGTHARTATPNATSGTSSKTVSPNAGRPSDRVMLPDARGISDHTRIDPNQ